MGIILYVSVLMFSEDQKTIGFNIDQYPFIIETVSLIDSLLPTNKGDLAESAEASLMQQAMGRTTESIAAQQKLDLEKRQIYSVGGAFEQEIVFAAEKLLPKIFNVHENNIQASIRNKTLSTIDKLILLFSEQMLNSFVEPYSFAKFIYSNLHSTNHLPSIQLCFQMVDKLMRSNPRAYTLPLVREGVVPSIKSLSTLEGLEKSAGVKFNMSSLETVVAKKEEPKGGAGEADKLLDQLLAPHELLEKAKAAILKGSSGIAGEDKAVFESTIQRYMELTKKTTAPPQSGADVAIIQQKQQAQQGKTILSLAQQLLTEYFENQEFLAKIYEQSGEEMQMMSNLKKLAQELTDEAKRSTFDFARNRDLMKTLAEALTKQKALMSYELKESGLLDALKNYLTMTPKQVELWQEKQKLQGEETKRSEEIQLSTMAKSANSLTKKQARSFIQRLKTFLHVMLNKVNERQPITQVINLCHDLISQSDYLIFESASSHGGYGESQFGGGGGFQISDPNNSMNALKCYRK